MYKITVIDDICDFGNSDISEWDNCEFTGKMDGVDRFRKVYDGGELLFSSDAREGVVVVEDLYLWNGALRSETHVYDLLRLAEMA